MSSNKQPKTEKQSTYTTQLVVASTLTQSTEIATLPTTLDALPDEILLHIEIVKECEKELKEYDQWHIAEIFHKLASGAVTFNREELLHWAIEKQNKFIFRAIFERAIKDKKPSIFQKVWNSIENENILTYMKQQQKFIYIAAEKGNLNWLIYLREELECEWNWEACSWAACGGHLDLLVYLHEHGCGWNSSACSSAACNGHIDCLTYLHKNGCPWNDKACRDAAVNGHLDCLQYMRDNGLEWNGMEWNGMEWI